jgi:hypothetical protein
MSEQTTPGGDPGRDPTEEELRAAYEAEIKRLRVEDVVVQTLVSLVNLGGRRAGFVPGAEDERDLEQVRMAIEGVKALLPLVEEQLGPEANTIRQAISQLQMMYAQASGAGGPEAEEAPPQAAQEPPAPPEPEPQQPGEPGPAQRSGRLWIPGQ